MLVKNDHLDFMAGRKGGDPCYETPYIGYFEPVRPENEAVRILPDIRKIPGQHRYPGHTDIRFSFVVISHVVRSYQNGLPRV